MYDLLNLVHIKEPTQIFGSSDETEKRAAELGISLSAEHWEVINFLRKFYTYQENEALTARDISRALEGKFKSNSLYNIFVQYRKNGHKRVQEK